MQQILGSGKSFLPMPHISLTKWINSGISKGNIGGGEELRPARTISVIQESIFMGKLINSGFFVYPTVVGMLLGMALFVAGCDESSQTEAERLASESVNEAQRLILASQEQMVLSEAELDKVADIGAGSTSRYTKIADQVVARYEKQAEFEDPCKITARIEQLSRQFSLAGGVASVQELCDNLANITEEFEAQQERKDGIADKSFDKRLNQAEATLQDAIAFAASAGHQSAKVSPELMLGTIKLMRARQVWGNLQSQSLRIQSVLLSLGYWAVAIERELSVAHQLDTFRPTKTVAELETERTSLAERLNLTERSIQHLLKQQSQAEQQYKENSQKAKQMHQEYLSLLEKAEKKLSGQQYELRERAYKVRSGTDEEPGGIYYEAQTELAQNRLDLITRRLEYQRFCRDRMNKNLAILENSIQQLSTSAHTTSDIENGIEQSIKAKTQMLSSMTRQLENITKEQVQYSRLLDNTTGFYDKAVDVYTKAARDAGSRSDTGKYAKDIIDKVIEPELAELWSMAMLHYKSAADTLALIQDIPETREMITTMIEQCRQKQQDAQTNAAKYTKEEPEEEQKSDQEQPQPQPAQPIEPLDETTPK